ncbi:gamma-glutamyl-gamma-aminobutyrate hydrolase family protein [Clostridium rectalis]|uniref:gamma-glutamyl-gamma-aminobutyrate hydrolase family protein n=1 Tax=Clostridium rectalis TaxID=2040295 RepID=UPI000F62FE0D|nr:gamma-glutamyl-gamma-aminobutyrate hydrolase family protein [Clostridium rectalis]
MKPIILISSVLNLKDSKNNYLLNKNYVDAIRSAGGIPILAPVTNDLNDIKLYVSMCDGLLLPGGEDVSPIILEEEPLRGIGYINIERDKFEFELFNEFRKHKKPILGICKGCQIIALSTGGKIYQDIFIQHGNTIEHSQPEEQLDELFHSVSIDENSKLYELFNSSKIRVNSWHHQAISSIGKNMKVTAKSIDGIIEAVESLDGLIMGIQWHPELLFKKHRKQLSIYKYLINQCIKIKKT